MEVIRESPLRDLLDHAIDYAGLFPPAALSMDQALAGYLSYRRSEEAWALGHFIVPAARLEELLAAVPEHAPDFTVSVTIGPELGADLDRIGRFSEAAVHRPVAVVAVEIKVISAAEVGRVAGRLAGLSNWYGEVPLSDHDGPILDALASAGGRAKIRMGGVTPESFPAPAAVARFLAEITARHLHFKATAGLHHPVRGRYRLTYAPDAPSGTMFGYLNLLAATHLARGKAAPAAVEAVLGLAGPDAFRHTGDAIVWDSGRLDRAAAQALRRDFHGFGSCSFREPIDELLPAMAS